MLKDQGGAPPKEWVMMTTHTAELFIGVRISLFDTPWLDDIQPPPSMGGDAYKIFFGKCDGWLFYRPDVAPVWFYINADAEGKYFEVLGEL